MSLDIRPAQPEDLDAIPLIYSSGPEAFEYIFSTHKHSAQDFLQYAFLCPGNLFAFDNHRVGIYNNEVICSAAFFDAKQYDKMVNNTLLKLVAFYKLRSIGVIKRLVQFSQVLTRPPENSTYLSHFGVASSARGQGVGRQMLEYGLKKARTDNKKTFSLDVAMTNPRAQALYERFGMNVISEHYFKPQNTEVPNGRRLSMQVLR